MKKLLFLLAAVGLIFTACQSGGDVEEENGGAPFVPEITISPKDLTFGCNGGEQTVDITANFEYEVAERASWITVEQTDEGLLVIVDANKNTSERSAFISITNSQYDINKSIEVYQEAWVPKIELAQQSIEVEFEPAEYEVAVTSPYSWEATTKSDWIVVESETGIAGEEKLKFTTLRNEEEQVRKGTITLKNTDYNLVAELYVIQKAFVPAITIEPETLTFAVEGGTQEVAITANFKYEVSANADWLTIKKSEKGISVTVPNYVEVENRTAEITISNKKYGISKVVKVTQGAFVPAITIEPKTLTFAVEGGKQEIAITANFEYEASANADWLTIEKSEKGISVTVPNYTEVEERTAEITISNEKYGISKVVKVAQGAFVPAITIEPETLTFAVEGGTQEVAITANFEYEVSANADWLTIKKSEKGVSVTVPNYVEVEERTAEITISNEKYGISKVVKATQETFVPAITIEPESLAFTFIGGTKEVAITANFEYEFSTNANWLTIKKSEKSVNISATTNTKFEECTAEITISNKKYNISKTISVVQKGVSAKPENVIIYTSSDGKIVTPSFGANIVSNIYSNVHGQGIIIFDAPVTSIGDYAFRNRTSLTTITIPDSVTSIGWAAFSGCTSLTSVTIPDSVTSIGYTAFSGCTSLTSITIPDSVTEIGESAFSRCTSLTSITIPDSVTSIGESAFSRCTSLTSITIPNSVTSIGDGAFRNCSSLTAFYGKFASADNRCLIIDGVLHSFVPAGLTQYTIPDSVTSIGNYAFAYCSSLTSVTIPDSVTSIGEEAFSYCHSLKSITIGNSVTSIGNYAFAYCSSLTSVTIGNSVTSIGYDAFSDCTSLTSITIPDSVTEIGDSAFKGCTGELIIDSKIIETDYSIDNYPAYPSNSSNNDWLYGAKFTKLTIGNSVTKIGSKTFYKCTSLTSVTMSDSVTSIGDDAFSGCKSLTSVTIPDSVTDIGAYAFGYCYSLTSVYITDLSAWCKISFSYNANPLCNRAKLYLNGSELANITIPSDITKIKNYAFDGCTSLTSVTIPDSVTSIGQSAFYNCTSLTSVYCKPTTPPTGGSYMFSYYYSGDKPIGCKIYVPRNSVSAYKAKQYWIDYADYIVGYDF